MVNEFSKCKDTVDRIIRHFAFRYLELDSEDERVTAERSIANRIGRNLLITSIPAGGENVLSPEFEELIK